MDSNPFDPPQGDPTADHNDINKQETAKPTSPIPEDPRRDHQIGKEIERGVSIEKDEAWDAT